MEDPSISKRNRKAKANRGAAETALPQNKVFKQVEMEYPLIPQQFWMPTPSTLAAANTVNTYSQPFDVLLQNQLVFSPLLGMHNQPLVVPNGYFKPMNFLLCPVFNEEAIAPGRLAFNNGQPYY